MVSCSVGGMREEQKLVGFGIQGRVTRCPDSPWLHPAGITAGKLDISCSTYSQCGSARLGLISITDRPGVPQIYITWWCGRNSRIKTIKTPEVCAAVTRSLSVVAGSGELFAGILVLVWINIAHMSTCCVQFSVYAVQSNSAFVASQSSSDQRQTFTS